MRLSTPEALTRYMLVVAGLGGLLYGIDVGIIAGALPYLEASAAQIWHLSAQQLGFVVAAVLLGSVLSSLGAGALSDALGRKPVMLISGLLFSLSIPVIALADASDRVSRFPADYLGMQDRGRLVPGARADIVVLDDELQVRSVLLHGRPLATLDIQQGKHHAPVPA